MEQCSICNKKYGLRQNLLRHQREQHSDKSYQCNQCSQSFSRSEHLLWHRRTHMKRPAAALSEEPSAQIPRIEPEEEEPSEQEIVNFLESTPYTDRQEKALRGYLTSYRLKYTQQQIDPINFMTNMTMEISRLISTHPTLGIKLWICLKITFEKATDPSETIDGYFCCKQKVILPGSDQESEIISAFPEIQSAIDNFEKRGSGWVIRQIQHADVHFSIYQPLRGSSYGQEPVRKFLIELVQIALAHQERINNPVPLVMTPDNWHAFNRSLHCCICEEYITGPKVKDHCHMCGKYRGAAHSGCNAGFRLNRDVTVVFHNLKCYDGHLIMQKLGELCKDMGLEIGVVAKGMEEYISFSIKNKPCKDNGASTGGDDDILPEEEEKDHYWSLKFIDSYQFLTNSLEGLVSNLDNINFNAMESQFNGEELELLLRKGVFPYDWLNNWHKFDYPLPLKHQFYSQLSATHISDEDYAHAKKIWQAFNMNNMGQYHDLYLKTDVLLLADVFESFRGFCLENYGLDPAHYMTLPSFGWDACLKMTNVQLDLLQDPEMYTFLESGIRGGISMISHRYAKANNPLVEGFDASKPTSYISYLDANNLYGWSMVQSLPTSNFKWVEDMKTLNWRTVSDDGPVGYILEVDLDYPEALHDAHNSYPLAPERLTIKDDILSPYCAELKHKMDIRIPPQQKLVPNLLPKTRYVVHYRNLQLYESQGLIVTKIHRAIQFQQRPWMKPYIEFNTEKRKQARTSFEKDLFKLLNNAVFGKTMENVQNYKDVKLVTSDAQFRKLAANPRYEYSAIFTEDLVAVKMKRGSTILCKPIYVGFTVLELSKELMYNFHYSHIVPKYGDQATLLFTDTDSLCYQIETSDIYEDMLADSHLFDTSDYPLNHALYSNANKKVLGKMKDETAGSPISEFCGLRSKMYSFVCEGVKKKRAKGIKKGVVTSSICHQDYVNTLFRECSTQHSMNLIRSEQHEIYSMTLTKKSLSAYDDKRYLMDNISSFAYGHVATKSFIG